MGISKYKIKGGKFRYKATFWDRGLPKKSISFDRKSDAEDWLSRERKVIQDQKCGRLRGESLEFEDFYRNTYILNAGIRESTKVDYERIYNMHLHRFCGKRFIADVRFEEWVNFFHLKKLSGVSIARLNRIHAVASAIYSLALRSGYVSINPLTLIPWGHENIPATKKYWSESEVYKFLTWSSKNSDFFSLYRFLYETGMRVSEVLALQWDCIIWSENFIEIRRNYSRIMKRIEQTTKSGMIRRMPIDSALKSQLLTEYEQRRSNFVFSKKSGEMISYETLRVRFIKDQNGASVQKIGIHGLRHTFASHYVMAGGNIYDLKALLGHSSIQTTMEYAHLSHAHLSEKTSIVQFRPDSD